MDLSKPNGQHCVTFLKSGAPTTVTVEKGTSLLQAAKLADALQLLCCGLKPPCGRCRMAIRDGDTNLSPTTELEVKTKAAHAYLAFERVGCLARVIHGDVVAEPIRK